MEHVVISLLRCTATARPLEQYVHYKQQKAERGTIARKETSWRVADRELYCRKTERQFKSRKQLYILIALTQSTTNLVTSEYAHSQECIRTFGARGTLVAITTGWLLAAMYCNVTVRCSCTSLSQLTSLLQLYILIALTQGKQKPHWHWFECQSVTHHDSNFTIRKPQDWESKSNTHPTCIRTVCNHTVWGTDRENHRICRFDFAKPMLSWPADKVFYACNVGGDQKPAPTHRRVTLAEWVPKPKQRKHLQC